MQDNLDTNTIEKGGNAGFDIWVKNSSKRDISRGKIEHFWGGNTHLAAPPRRKPDPTEEVGWQREAAVNRWQPNGGETNPSSATRASSLVGDRCYPFFAQPPPRGGGGRTPF